MEGSIEHLIKGDVISVPLISTIIEIIEKPSSPPPASKAWERSKKPK